MKQDILNMLLELQFEGKIIEIKHGAFGIVYIVEHERRTFPRYIACKTINPKSLKEVSSKQRSNLFLNETKQWFKYGSYHWILTPFNVQNICGMPYICMTFCKSNLRKYIENSDLSSEKTIARTLRIFIETIKGLIYAQSQGLISHQDLKPENILLTDNSQDNLVISHDIFWEPRISDFGMANAWKELKLPYGTRIRYVLPLGYILKQWKLES